MLVFQAGSPSSSWLPVASHKRPIDRHYRNWLWASTQTDRNDGPNMSTCTRTIHLANCKGGL